MSDVARAKRRRAERTPGGVHVEPRPPERTDHGKECPCVLTEHEHASAQLRHVSILRNARRETGVPTRRSGSPIRDFIVSADAGRVKDGTACDSLKARR